MADVFRRVRGNPKIEYYPKDTTTTSLKVGDMVKVASGVATPVAAATDNLAFRGICFRASDAGSSNQVGIEIADAETEYSFPLDTATTFTAQQEFQINAVQALKAVSGTTDPVAIATVAGTSASVANVKFKIPASFIQDAS